MQDKFYKFNLPNGEIYIFGDNLEKCIPFIEDVTDSIVGMCEYCSNHKLHIFHNPNRGFKGVLEYIYVYWLTKKYGVHSSVKEVDQYLRSLGV